MELDTRYLIPLEQILGQQGQGARIAAPKPLTDEEQANVTRNLAPPPPERGLISGSLAAGANQLVGGLGSALQAVGTATNLPSLAQYGASVAENRERLAQEALPERYRIAPWREGGGGWAAAPGYFTSQLIQQVPLIAGTVATAGLGAGVGAVAGGARAASLGGYAGAGLARAATSTGQMYQQAVEGGIAGPESARAALALSPLYAGLELFAPLKGLNMVRRGLEGNLKQRVATGLAGGFAAEGLTEAAQTGLEQSFRPDLTLAQKADNVIDAAIVGGVIGGTLGGAGGALRRAQKLEPNQTDNDTLKNTVDDALAPPPPPPPPIVPAAPFKEYADNLDPIVARDIMERVNATAPENRTPQQDLLAGELNRRFGATEQGTQQDELAAQQEAFFADRANKQQMEAAILGAAKSASVNSKQFEPFRQNAETPQDVFNNILDQAYSDTTKKSPAKLAKSLGLMADGNLSLDDQYAQWNSNLKAEQDKLAAIDYTTDSAGYTEQFRNVKALEFVTDAANTWYESRKQQEAQSAIQEPSPAGVDVLQPTQVGGEVVQGVPTARQAAPTFAETQQEARRIENEKNIAWAIQKGQPDTDMAEALTPYKIEQEKRLSEAQKAAQDVQAREAAFLSAEVQRAEQAPVRLDVRAAKGSESQQTVAGFNALTAEQQNAILNREDFGGDINALRDLIIKTKQKGQAALRQNLANYAGVTPEAFQQAVVESELMAGMTDQQREDFRVVQSAAATAQQRGMPDPLRRQLAQAQNAARTGILGFETDLKDAAFAAQKWRLDNDPLSPAFMRAKEPDLSGFKQVAPLRPEKFDQAFAQAMNKLSPKSREFVQAVETQADLPQNIRTQAEQQSREERTPISIVGVYDPKTGQTYIVRENVRSADDIFEAMAHEVLGHGGLAALRQQNPQLSLNDLYARAGGDAGVLKLARKFGVEKDLKSYMGPGVSAGRIIDELLAQVQGKSGEKLTMAARAFVGKMKELFVAGLRKAGLSSWAKWFDKFSVNDMALMMRRMWKAGQETPAAETIAKRGNLLDAQNADQAAQFMRVTTQDVGKLLGGAQKGFLDKLSEWSPKAIREGAKWLTRDGMFGMARKTFGDAATRLENAVKAGENISGAFSQLSRDAAHFVEAKREKGEPAERTAAKNINTLMNWSKLGIDARKSWDAHTHLKDAENAVELEQMVRDANNMLHNISKTKMRKDYDRLINVNQIGWSLEQFGKLAAAINTFAPGMKVTGVDLNALEKLPNATTLWDGHAKANDKWAADVDSLLKQVNAYVEANKGDKTQAAKLSRLKDVSDIVGQNVAKFKEAPYFHVARFGDYTVEFNIKSGADNVVDKAALNRISKALADNGFTDVDLMLGDPKSPRVFMMVENAQQAQGLVDVLNNLQNTKDLRDLKSGKKKEGIGGLELDPAMRKLVDALEEQKQADLAGVTNKAAADAIERQYKTTINQLRGVSESFMPDRKAVLLSRENVRGASTDMLRAYAKRSAIQASALGNLATSTKAQNAIKEMEAQIEAKALNVAEQERLRAVLDSVQDYVDATYASTKETGTGLRYLTKMSYAYYMSSPASAILQLVTLPTFVVPELGKKYGFRKSMNALIRSGNEAMKILNVLAAEGARAGVSGADIRFSPEALVKAGIKRETVDFLLQVANRGDIDLNTAAVELARIGKTRADESGKVDTALRLAGYMNQYTEAFVRLNTALAVQKLAGNQPNVADIASKAINNTSFNFRSSNTPIAFTEQGVLGRFTPVAFQFMRFPWMVMGKLMREGYTAFGKGLDGLPAAEAAQLKSEARKFLLGHAAAMTAISGTLGLPFVGMAAGLFNTLADAFGDDEPTDIMTAYRGFLANAFGKNAGEIIARGLPRALGIDIAQRAGEADLLPFSRFIQDRRELKDKWKELMTDLPGAPVGFIAKVFEGVDKLSDGKFIEGSEQILPAGLANVVKGGRLAFTGKYTDARGRELPMDAGVLDGLKQMFGFKPAELGEYQEANLAKNVRQSILTRESTKIRKDFVDALIKGDRDNAMKAVQRALEFDKTNPAFAIIPGLERAVKARIEGGAKAKALGVPLGTREKDIAGMRQYQGTFNWQGQ